MPLHIQERNIRDIVIMDLYGNLDFNTAPELKVKLDSLIKFGHQKIIINLARVDFIDSTGVGSLMYALKLLDTTMGDIKIIGLSPQNQNVFSVLELDRVFSILNSETQAIETLNGISMQLTTATSEQDKGANQMELAMENINVRAHEIQDSTSRQKGEGDSIKTIIQTMKELTQKVTEATLMQSQSSHKIVEKMNRIGKIASESSQVSQEVNSRAGNLTDAVDVLERMISQFTISENHAPAAGGQAKGMSLVDEN